MKSYFKGKTAGTKPMYSRNLIHPRVYKNTPSCIVKYIVVVVGSTHQCLNCGLLCRQIVHADPWCIDCDTLHSTYRYLRLVILIMKGI